MKTDEVQVGGTYIAKVGARSVEVSIERENPKGGWDAKSVATGKPVRVKDAKHLRPTSGADDAQDGGGEDAGDAPAEAPSRKRKGTKKVAAPKAPKAPKPPKEKAPAKEKKLSCLDAAAQVLKASGQPMACRPLIDEMHKQGLWTSDAPTPHATLFSALLREIGKKGDASRFRKVDRGQFAFNEPKGE